jgi:hypothetical protein
MQSPHKRQANVRRDNARLHPLHGRVNGNTPRGRRVRALYRSFMTKLPDDDANAQATALRAAELTIIAEDVRATVLACELDAKLAGELVRVENLAARARREVAKLEDPHKGEKTLADVLREIETSKPVDDDDGIEPPPVEEPNEDEQ